MILFLTSSPTGPLDQSYHVEALDHKNHFVENLKYYWKTHSRCCLIAANPETYQRNDEMCDFFKNVFFKEDFSLETMDLYDYRYPLSKEKLLNYDVILLAGGHVPTQNRYFKEIDLKEKIKDFQGIVIGISAGSMNCAHTVYVQPEESGESLDPNFKRWILGLNLTKQNILPHYQMVKDYCLDGKKLFEEITYPDSIHHCFLVLEDGSYLLSVNNQETVYGKSYLLHDGKLEILCHENEKCKI